MRTALIITTCTVINILFRIEQPWLPDDYKFNREEANER